jgi:hypothetical protein
MVALGAAGRSGAAPGGHAQPGRAALVAERDRPRLLRDGEAQVLVEAGAGEQLTAEADLPGIAVEAGQARLLTAMPSKQVFATLLKQPENGPPLASVDADTNSVKNQWPPLLPSCSQEMSPPLDQPLAVRPMIVSSGMTPDCRCRPLS